MATNKDLLLPAQRLNPWDRLVTFFNPEAGVKRMQDRTVLHNFGYNDAPERRGKAPTIQSTGGEAYGKQRDRIKAMSDARDLAMYDWIGGTLSKLTLYTVGKLQAKTSTGDPSVDEAYDHYFHSWCGDEPGEGEMPRCDLTGRNRFIKMVQHAFMGFLIDGDHGFVEVDPEFSPTGRYTLQNIGADRIGNPTEEKHSETYVGGINFDKATGRIISYKVYRRTRTGMYVDPVEYNPEQFIHLIDADRSDEYRGRTKLLRLLNDMRDIREINEAEKVAIKTQSQWAAMFGTKDPYSGTGPDKWDGKTAAGTNTQEAQWGKVMRMGHGENFSMITPSARPSGAYMAFYQMLIRKMAVSLGVSYGLMWDLATLGGVTARIEVQADLRRIQYWQALLVDKILNRVRRKVLAEGIANRELEPHPAWTECAWSFGPWLSTDVGYETEADLRLAASGLLPVDDITGKYGYHPSEVFQRNAATANAAIIKGTEGGMPVEVFAAGLYPNLTEQKAAFDSPVPPPPPPGSQEAIGDKGIQSLIEIVQSVKDSMMDRESAINTLMTTFGLSRQHADSLVPPEPTKAELAAQAPQPPQGGKQVGSQTPKKK
jgi:capsid protein